MGIFNTAIEIGNPSGSRFETISALVDTGASFTTLPGPFLYSLGVTPHDRFTFTMADGRQIRRDVGQTWIRIGDRSVITLVVFGDENVEPLLGAYSLQGLVLAVDPPNERLIPSPRLLL